MRSAFQSNKSGRSLAELVNWSRRIGKMDKQDAQGFFNYSIEVLRQAYLKNMEINELVSFSPSTGFNFTAFSKFITENNIEDLSSGFENAIYESKRNVKLSMIATGIAFKTTKLIHEG
jgi:DNA polymerase-3 subunit delta'